METIFFFFFFFFFFFHSGFLSPYRTLRSIPQLYVIAGKGQKEQNS